MSAPEGATSTLSAAPPDRQTLPLEKLLNQARATLFADDLSPEDMRAFRGFVKDVIQHAQAKAAQQPAGPAGQPAAPPPNLHADNMDTSDFGSATGPDISTVQGA